MSTTEGASAGANVTYELFVLGELMDRPLHGYLLHQIIGKVIGPFRQLSWGALYPLIRRLEHEALIKLIEPVGAVASEQDGRPRKVYAISDAGRRRFHELMLRTGDFDADYAFYFDIQLGNFGRVDLAEQQIILRRYRVYLEATLAHIRFGQEHVANTAGIPAAARPHVLNALGHRRAVVEHDVRWVDVQLGGYTGKGRS